MKFALVTLASIALASFAFADDGRAEPAPMTKTFDIIGVEGSSIGNVKLTQGPTGVVMRVELSAGSLSPGWHGLHFHSVGDCSDIGAFKKSGGHVGLIPGGHGLLNPDGPERGDLTNIWAHTDGSAGYEIFTEAVTLSQGEHALLDADGSAVVIHANPDDHISQPIGGAGPRVACAVLK